MDYLYIQILREKRNINRLTGDVQERFDEFMKVTSNLKNENHSSSRLFSLIQEILQKNVVETYEIVLKKAKYRTVELTLFIVSFETTHLILYHY